MLTSLDHQYGTGSIYQCHRLHCVCGRLYLIVEQIFAIVFTRSHVEHTHNYQATSYLPINKPTLVTHGDYSRTTLFYKTEIVSDPVL